ncbi:MAG: Uma2 family endonuclease [Methylovulum sp.]|nr:Uma2 family endonuclease [Methylovulum sp.]
MSAVKNIGLTSVEDYLKWELTSEVKHELIGGYVYAMVGSSDNHDYISGNIYRKFGNHLENSTCRPFTSDKKLKTSTGNFRYPDCMVICDKDDESQYYKTKPIILVEVLSRSTRKTDEKDKLIEYMNISTLQEYVLIEQDYVDITVYRRSDDWHSIHYFLGETIYFESIDLTISVEEIYHRVQNDDMVEFLSNKSE